jgi:peptide/nickel transport system permease protein
VRYFLLRRLAEMALALVVMSLIVFLLARALGDPVSLLLSEFATEADRQALTRELGLDRALPVQYFTFLLDTLRGDLGNSVMGARQPVLNIILDRLPASLWLATVALVLSVIVGLPLGVVAAVRRGTWVDAAVRLVALVGQAVPIFWLGIVLMFVFGVQLGWLPTSGYGSARHFILPATTMGLFTLAAVARLTRVSMLEALDSEYVRLARIKGLTERAVIFQARAFQQSRARVDVHGRLLRNDDHGRRRHRDRVRVARNWASRV